MTLYVLSAKVLGGHLPKRDEVLFTSGSILVPIAVLWSLRLRPLRPNQNLHMVVFVAQYVGSSSQQAQSLFSQHPLTGRPPLKREGGGMMNIQK